MAFHCASLSRDRGGALNSKGLALQAQGERLGGLTGLELLNSAVAVYEAAKREYDHASEIDGSLMAELNVANTLQILGVSTSGLVGLRMLWSSISVYKEVTEKAPANSILWAKTKNNIGNSFQETGLRTPYYGQDLLKSSVNSYEDALTVFSPDESPDEWASTHNNIGNALSELAKNASSENANTLLRKAIRAFKMCSSLFFNFGYKAQWAQAQHNLAISLKELAFFSNKTESLALLNDAQLAAENALTVRTLEVAPAEFAYTKNSLGNIFSCLAREAKGVRADAYLTHAVECFDEALIVLTPEHFAYHHEIATRNRANAVALIRERGGTPPPAP